MSVISYQFPPLEQQQTATSDIIPEIYNHMRIPFTDATVIYNSGPWGIMINQCVKVGGYTYEEQYFEPVIDIDVQLFTKRSLLALHCILDGNIKVRQEGICGTHLKEGKLR